MAAVQPIVDFADELMLRERLARAFPEGRGRVPSVAVGFAQEGRAAFACTKSASSALPAQCAQATRGAPAAALALHAGCLTKLFTAALAAQACAEGRVALDERLAPALSLPRGPAFEGITLRHLLEHTHGLDDSAVAAVPLRKDGRIDAAALGRRLSEAPPLAEPGRLYSYSNAGAWLIAAWLERTSGQTYGRLLHERILAPLRDTGARAEALDTRGGLCPATGGALKVSLRTVLRFLAAHSPRDVLHGDRSGSRRVTPLPGWNALERGVYLGWKYHGEGWLGHQSVWPEISALVRVQAQAGLALVVACRSVPAAIAAAKLFGTLLPEFESLRIPKPLTQEQAAGMDLRLYTGLYASARRAVLIHRRGERLALRACTLDAKPLPREESVEARLRPSEKRIFFTDPPAGQGFPFVQFVSPYRGGFRHVWNGRFLLRKLSC